MTKSVPVRGGHIVAADRRFSKGGGLFARLLARGFRSVVDQIDQGLEVGAIEATLPGGAFRRLGGRSPGPVAVVHLHSWNAMVRLVASGSVGWARGWLDGEWSSPDPMPLFDLFIRNRLSLGSAGRAKGPFRLKNRIAHAWRANTQAGSKRNIAFHYDLGNDFYSCWLDATMTYSSALFAHPISDTEALEDAQQRKMRRLIDRLQLRPGDTMLEIGSGWGGLVEMAAGDGADVLGITLSKEQLDFARERIAAAGLSDRARFALIDYREVEGQFDAVASVEMIEAVGEEYWPDYIDAIARALRPGGRAALQFISIDDAIFEGYRANADFIQAMIFPGGLLVSESRLRALAEKAGLTWQDRADFGIDYAETLKRWRERFDAAVNEGRLPAGFDDRFLQLWRYYLMYCEGGFRGGGIDVAQVTLTKT